MNRSPQHQRFIVLVACGFAGSAYGCNDDASLPSDVSIVCPSGFDWTVETVPSGDVPPQRQTVTGTDGAFCYADGGATLMHRCIASTGGGSWDEGVPSDRRAQVIPDGDEVLRVVEVDADTVVLRSDELDEAVPGCGGLMAAYRKDGCIGVITRRCDARDDGAWYSHRSSAGRWTRQRLVGYRPPSADTVAITAISCDQWVGVWGAVHQEGQVEGVVTLRANGESVETDTPFIDTVLGTPAITRDGSLVVAARLNGDVREIGVFEIGTTRKTIDHAEHYPVGGDIAPVAGRFRPIAAADRCAVIVYSELGPLAVESVRMAIRADGGWSVTRLSDVAVFQDEVVRGAELVPWSMAFDGERLILDFATHLHPTPSGHVRFVGMAQKRDGPTD